MKHAQTVWIDRPLSGHCYSSDSELMAEIVEAVAENIGDVRYGSSVLDVMRRQATFKLEDGRTLRITFMIE